MNARIVSSLRLFAIVAAASFCVVLAGCVSTSAGPDPKYERGGIAYGVTKGPFRGRWWNYYERARSFSDGGFWIEAEEDLRVAMTSRARDQLWPRTYGLHFTPEYFPHRELGVVLFEQGRFDEAIPELESSLSQQMSARAAFYLDRARRAAVESRGGDSAPPTIEIVSPDVPAIVGAPFAVLSGIARDDSYVVAVTVDGEPQVIRVSESEIGFSDTVMLEPGMNEIEIAVRDLFGNETTETIAIASDVDGPAVSFDRPIRLPGLLSGVSSDPAGVASIEVNGQPISLEATPDGGARFAFEWDKADTAPEYQCIDRFGNVTRGIVPADAAMLSRSVYSPATGAKSFREYRHGANLGVIGGLLAAATWGAAATEPRIRFASLRDGQQYLMDEIIVALDVDADAPVAEVRLNDLAMDMLPGRNLQSISRRVLLEPGPNEFIASVRDESGGQARSEVRIERVLQALEDRTSRLSVAMAGSIWTGNDPQTSDAAAFVSDELSRELERRGRFNILDRSLLPEVISEQQLSAALASVEGRLALGQLAPVEVLLVGRIHRDLESVEIVVEAISTETSLFLARADVAGAADSPEALASLARDLALRIVQEFPRAEGAVVTVRGDLPPPIENRKRVAILSPAWLETSPTHAALLDAMLPELERELLMTEKLTVVDRSLVDAMTAEVDFSQAASSPENRLAIGRRLNADWLVTGRVTPSGDGVRIQAEVVDAATSQFVARVNVEGPAESGEDTIRLARRLAEQIEREADLPKTAGSARSKELRFVSDLGGKDRVRESMKYVVYRYGEEVLDPISGSMLGKRIEVVGEALVDAVSAEKSTAEVVTGRQAPQLLTEGDHVATK